MALVRGVMRASIWETSISVGARIDIDVDRRRANHHDRFGGRKEGVRDRDHLIALTNPGSAQGQVQRVRPIGDRDAALDVAVRGELFLEGQRVRPEKEVHLVEDVLDRLHHLVLDGPELGRQVNQRNTHAGSIPHLA